MESLSQAWGSHRDRDVESELSLHLCGKPLNKALTAYLVFVTVFASEGLGELVEISTSWAHPKEPNGSPKMFI